LKLVLESSQFSLFQWEIFIAIKKVTGMCQHQCVCGV
jgi:hypothetical protein